MLDLAPFFRRQFLVLCPWARATIARHHAIQLDLLQQLFRKKVPLVLCLEQLEARDQPAVDRYSRGETDFATFAGESDWPKRTL